MRASFFRSLTATVLTLTSTVSWSAPAWALRTANKAETKAGMEELQLALQTDPDPVPTWTWSASQAAVSLEQRTDLLLQAKANTQGAFALGRAVAVAGHGKNPRIPKSLRQLSSYLESVLENELAALVGDSGAMADDPVLHHSPLMALGKPASVVEWIKRNVRFVTVNDDANGYLAGQGVEGTGDHAAVVAYAGWYAYPQWREGLSPEMVAAIESGVRARLQNQPLRPDELPGPASVYLSQTQIREFMKGGDLGRQAFAIKLAHEIKDVVRQGRHEDESPALTQTVNGFITQHMRTIQQARRDREQARQEREERKLTKLHVTADLSGLLSGPVSADQRRQIVRKAEETLQGFQKEGIIFGFNVYLFNQGKLLVVDLDYREGGDPTRKLAAIAAIKMAVRLGLLKAQTLGLAPAGSDTELLSRVKLYSGENQLTQRASEPVVSVQGIGLGMGAFNRTIWHLLVGDVGHLQAIAGDRGFRVVVANLSDIRQGKKQYRVYEFEVPGVSEGKIQQIIERIQAGQLTEDDLRDETSQNLHQLHRLIGAMDEYAIEGVYALPGSRFAAKQGDETVTLTDEPIIKVHLHENPVAEFRAQSGAWATGSYQKVLTMPNFGPNAEQNRWVGMIPVTLEEAEDPSVLEQEGWPVGEMGFMTAWAWSYDRGGTGRGEPPVTDVFGKNDQARINRKTLSPLMEVWRQLGNFEPRLTAQEAARRASTAAALFPFVEKGPEGTPATGVWQPIPDLKKEEVDAVVARFQGEGKLTWSFFKADIGGKAGHDQVLQTHMAAARAKLEEAKEQGLIQDFKVFFVGDDMQLAILHKKGVQSPEMHALAWQVFSFGYWVTYTLGLEPYGHAQDIKIADEFRRHPIEHHAKLTQRAVELLQADFERGAKGDADVPEPLRANAQAALSSALGKWNLVEASLKKWQDGAAGTVVTDAVSVGNVTGMGIGWAEQPAEEGVELAYYGMDKSGAGGFNIRLASMMSDALAAGDLRPTDRVEMWDVEQHRRIFLRVGEDMASILDMAAQVNKYNFKRILDGDNGNIIGWLSSEILAQTAHGYVGKDDPILVMVKRVGRHVAETFRNPQRSATAQLGDEAGSHQLANVIRAWWSSFPGEKSNPVGTAITFRVVDGKIEMEDEGSKPEFDAGRVAAEDFNREFGRVQGEFSPLVANRGQIEETYPRARMLAEADKNPTRSVDRVDLLAAGLEETAQALVKRAVAGDLLGVPQRENGRTLTVVSVPAPQERAAMQLYVQSGLEEPQGLPATVWIRAYPADLAQAAQLLKNSPPLDGAFFLLNNRVVNQQTAAAWLPASDHAAALANPRLSGQELGRIMQQIVALAALAKQNGQILEINSISFIQTQRGTFAVIESA